MRGHNIFRYQKVNYKKRRHGMTFALSMKAYDHRIFQIVPNKLYDFPRHFGYKLKEKSTQERTTLPEIPVRGILMCTMAYTGCLKINKTTLKLNILLIRVMANMDGKYNAKIE